MDDARGRGSTRDLESESDSPVGPERLLSLVVLCVLVGLPLAVSVLDVSPYRVTVGTAVVGSLLLVGSIALPALLLSKWQSAED